MTNYSTFSDGNETGSEAGAMARYVSTLIAPTPQDQEAVLSPGLVGLGRRQRDLFDSGAHPVPFALPSQAHSTLFAKTFSNANVTCNGRPKRGRSPKEGGQASMMSSNINLLNTIVGAGTLAMPHAMSQMGMLLGTFIIVWSGVTSAFGLYLQARCARYLDRGSSSFFALSQLTYPNAAVIFDAAIAVKCFGVAVSYLIIIGDLMPGVVRGFNESADRVPFLVDRNFWITAFMLIIIPLSFLRRLDSLKYTSVIALISIGYLIVLVVYHFASDSVENRGEVSYIAWNGAVSFLSSLPVVVFAYTCHQNMFSVINEIKDNTPASIVGVISSSIGSAASIYVLVAITGYLTFGNTVLGNIVMMYPSSAASTIGKAAIVVLVMFSVPLQVHPCRASLDAVLRWRPNRTRRGPDSPSNRSLLPNSSGPTDSHGAPAVSMSDMRFALLTTVIIVLAYITSLTVSQLDRVLAYVGATGSTSISFILPGLFYYKISDPDSIHHQRLTKEDDDVDANDSDDTDIGFEPSGSGILEAGGSIRSGGVSAGYGGWWRMRKRWRWDMEHIEHGLLRRLALCLAVYGMCVMVVCLVLNTFFTVAH